MLDPPSLDNIAEEVVNIIFSPLDKRSLTQLTYTSKTLSRIAIPHLWATLKLTLSFENLPKYDRQRLHVHLTENPHLAAHVKELWIKCTGLRIDPEFWIPWFTALINLLPNLHSFIFTDDFFKRSSPDHPLQQLLAPLRTLPPGQLKRLDLDFNQAPIAEELCLLALPVQELHIRRPGLGSIPGVPPDQLPSPQIQQSPITHVTISEFQAYSPRRIAFLQDTDTDLQVGDWNYAYTRRELLEVGQLFPNLVSFTFIPYDDEMPDFYARNLMRVVEKDLETPTPKLKSLVIGGRHSKADHAPARWGHDCAADVVRKLRYQSEIQDLDVYAGSLLEPEGPEQWVFDLTFPETLQCLTLRKVERMYNRVLEALQELSEQGVRRRFPDLRRITIFVVGGEVEGAARDLRELPFQMMESDGVYGTVAQLRERFADEGVWLEFREERIIKALPLSDEFDKKLEEMREKEFGGPPMGIFQYCKKLGYM